MSDSTLEQQIMNSVRDGFVKDISTELVGYNKPLTKLTASVVESHAKELFDLIDGEFVKVLGGTEFRRAVKSALNTKLAQVLIQRAGGELEKRVNELKANAATRAKITLAIDKIISEESE